jgi:hypothetical protein
MMKLILLPAMPRLISTAAQEAAKQQELTPKT